MLGHLRALARGHKSPALRYASCYLDGQMVASMHRAARRVYLAALLLTALVSPALALHRETPPPAVSGGSPSISVRGSWSYLFQKDITHPDVLVTKSS
jgi:hypothetical protein